jgi:hypothetical protein
MRCIGATVLKKIEVQVCRVPGIIENIQVYLELIEQVHAKVLIHGLHGCDSLQLGNICY